VEELRKTTQAEFQIGESCPAHSSGIFLRFYGNICVALSTHIVSALLLDLSGITFVGLLWSMWDSLWTTGHLMLWWTCSFVSAVHMSSHLVNWSLYLYA